MKKRRERERLSRVADAERVGERGVNVNAEEADSPRGNGGIVVGESLEKRSTEATAEVDGANYNFPIKTSVEKMLPRRRC